MKSEHRKTLRAVFSKPTLANIAFADIEALVAAAGGQVREGEGSRVAFELGGGPQLYLHRPHPAKEAKKYQIEKIRSWLDSKGIKP